MAKGLLDILTRLRTRGWRVTEPRRDNDYWLIGAESPVFKDMSLEVAIEQRALEDPVWMEYGEYEVEGGLVGLSLARDAGSPNFRVHVFRGDDHVAVTYDHATRL